MPAVIAALVLVLALVVSPPATHPWPVLVSLGRWLAGAAAALALAATILPLRAPQARLPPALPLASTILALLSLLALTGHNPLPGRTFSAVHPATFGLPTELAWVLIGLGATRLRARDPLGRGVLALGLGWALATLLAPDVVHTRVEWAWAQGSVPTLVALLGQALLVIAGVVVVVAPRRASKNVWGIVALAGPIVGGLLVLTSLAAGDVSGVLVGALLALLSQIADQAMERKTSLATRLETTVAAVILLVWLLLKLHAFVPGNTDENIYFYMAKLVSQGKMPYKDFFFAHPPLHVMLPGIAFTIFGASITLGKLFSLTATALIGFGVWRIARKGFQPSEPTALSRAVGLVAMVLVLFGTESLKASSNMTGVNETTAWLVMGALCYFKKRPWTAGILFGCAATTGFYAMAAICAFLALGFFGRKGFGWRQLAGFVALFAMVNLLFYAIGGDGFLDGVYRYHGEKDLRDPAMVELFGGELGFPRSFFHNLSVMAAGNPLTKEYFHHAHMWLGALTLPLVAIAAWLARGERDTGGFWRFFDPRRLVDDPLGPAKTVWLVALALFVQYSLFRELYSFYFILIYPFLALVTAYALLHGFAALARPAGKWRVGLVGALAPILIAWHPAVALSNQTVFDDELESLGERNEYEWTTAPALAWAPVLSDVSRVLFWGDQRLKGDVEPGAAQYLRDKKRTFEDLDAIGKWVAEHVRPDQSIAGGSTLAPLIAMVADRRIAADEVDTNSKRFETKLLTDEKYWNAICADHVQVVISTNDGYFNEDRMLALHTVQRWFRKTKVFEDNSLKYRRPYLIAMYERVGDGPCRYER